MDVGDEEIITFWKRMQAANVQYIMVGGFAVMLHGGTRTTEDVDIWLKDTLENRKRLREVFEEYGYSKHINFENMQFVPGLTSFFIANGIELDIMTRLSGFPQESFDDCYKFAYKAIIEDVEVPFLHINHLITEKRKVGRPKDLLDLAELERIRNFEENKKNNNT